MLSLSSDKPSVLLNYLVPAPTFDPISHFPQKLFPITPITMKYDCLCNGPTPQEKKGKKVNNGIIT